MHKLNLRRREDAQDRGLWWSGIPGNRPTRASAENPTLNDDDHDNDFVIFEIAITRQI